MVSILSRGVNSYSRFIGRIFMFLLPAALVAGLAYYAFELSDILVLQPTEWLFILWYAFLLNSLVLSLNGVFVSISFDREVRRLFKRGTPITSAAGFRNLEKKYKASNLYLLFILLFAAIAFGLFTFLIYGASNFANVIGVSVLGTQTLALYLSASMIIFSLAATIIIRVPTLTGLEVGNLVRYYNASRHPVILKSLVYDSIQTLLDPLTRVYFLQWSEIIANDITADFAPKLKSSKERQPLAVQNVLVLLYLHFRLPNLIDKKYLKDELLRIVSSETVDEILKGKNLNLKVWKNIFSHFMKQSPEIFLIIDRIILTLRETPEVIDAKDFWISSAVPPTQKKEESQDLVFFILNRRERDKKDQIISMNYKGADDLSPHDLDIDFPVRSYDSFVSIPKDTSKFLTEEKRKLVRLVTGILYQGTAIWISAHSENIGSNLVALDFASENEVIATQIFNLKVVRDFRFYLQTWGPKILASLGLFLPILRAILGL
ncbi:MAG: hypothetical protein HGN29_05520 [Asgard group archaeon]|nr:hypothetical protein [Asgard group archaeon]